MARSLKKGPYVEEALQNKITKMNANSELFKGHAGSDKTAKRK